MADKLTTKQKKEWAKTLYTKEGITIQKHLAEKVGISENTISRWVREEEWEKWRNNMLLTREEQMQNLLMELVQINESIQKYAPGKRFADSKLADVRRKLIKDIKELETKASVAEMIHTAQAFIKFVSATDFEMAKTVATLFDSFIKSSLK